jgi:hypothetical protein
MQMRCPRGLQCGSNPSPGCGASESGISASTKVVAVYVGSFIDTLNYNNSYKEVDEQRKLLIAV